MLTEARAYEQAHHGVVSGYKALFVLPVGSESNSHDGQRSPGRVAPATAIVLSPTKSLPPIVAGIKAFAVELLVVSRSERRTGPRVALSSPWLPSRGSPTRPLPRHAD